MQVENDEYCHEFECRWIVAGGIGERPPEMPSQIGSLYRHPPHEPQENACIVECQLWFELDSMTRSLQCATDRTDALEICTWFVNGSKHQRVVLQYVPSRPAGDEIETRGTLIPAFQVKLDQAL